jgi:hypothetical protein
MHDGSTPSPVALGLGHAEIVAALLAGTTDAF